MADTQEISKESVGHIIHEYFGMRNLFLFSYLKRMAAAKKKQNIAEAETYFKAKLYYRNDIERLEKKFDNTYVE